jgi:hypothetical protein
MERNMKTSQIIAVLAAGLIYVNAANAKLPPPPPVDPAAAAAKAEKDKAAAEKTKADQSRYEDKAVASFQANMRKTGKPVPKPTPIVAPTPPATLPAANGAKPPAVPAVPAKKA